MLISRCNLQILLFINFFHFYFSKKLWQQQTYLKDLYNPIHLLGILHIAVIYFTMQLNHFPDWLTQIYCCRMAILSEIP